MDFRFAHRTIWQPYSCNTFEFAPASITIKSLQSLEDRDRLPDGNYFHIGDLTNYFKILIHVIEIIP